LTDPLVSQLSNLCEIYNLTPEDLHTHWEEYDIKQNKMGISGISAERIDDFSSMLLQKRTIENSKSMKVNNTFKRQSNNMYIDSDKIYNKDSFKDIENLDSIVSGISKTNKMRIPVTNTRYSLTSPDRKSQFNRTINSPISDNILSPTKYGNTEKNNEITNKFNTRQRKGNLEVELNKEIPKPKIDIDVAKEVSVELINGDQQIDCYRYMFSKLEDIGEIMNDKIDEISELIRERNDIEYFNPPQLESSEEIITAGRLSTDVLDLMDSINTKINDRSYILEASQKTGSGSRIRLNFSKLANEGKEYTIFPGQIIGVKGTNPTGKCIDITEIIEPPPLPIPASSIEELSQFYSDDKKQPISVFVASGPYTCEDSLQYEPFNELFDNYILPEKPNVLILMGPFVDDRHPYILNGKTELFPEEIFKQYISPKINQFYKSSPHSTIILIPSLNDMLSESICFPQPPLDCDIIPRKEQFSVDNEDIYQQKVVDTILNKRSMLGLPTDLIRFKCFPNPVQFQINDIIFAVSNNDIISHMYNEEFYRPARSAGFGSPFKGNTGPNHRPMDRISRLTRHLLQQRSLYPLFPPAIDDANINYEHSKGFSLNIKPDILILNSAVRLFAKNIDDVVCVNPGQVVHKVAGTFSQFYIYPMDLSNHLKEIKKEEFSPVKMEEDHDGLVNVKKEETDMEIDNINIVHEVSKRCRVEIRRV